MLHINGRFLYTSDVWLVSGFQAWPAREEGLVEGLLTVRWDSPRKQVDRPEAWEMRLPLARPSSEVVRAICRCHPGPHASM